MNTPPIIVKQSTRFETPKKVLGGFHFGLSALLALCSLVLLASGIFRAASGVAAAQAPQNWLALTLALGMASLFCVIAFRSGGSLWRGQVSGFTLGTGIWLLLVFPIGTAIGIWTLIVYFGSRKV